VRAVEKVMIKFMSIALGMTIALSAIGLDAQATSTNIDSSLLIRQSTANLYAQVLFNGGINNSSGQSRNSQPENYPNFNNNYYSKPNPANIPSSIDRNQNNSNTSKPVKRKNNYVESTYDRLPGKASYTPIDRLGDKSCGKNYQFRNGKCESLNN
jgi:hypothetical protein